MGFVMRARIVWSAQATGKVMVMVMRNVGQ